MEVPIEEPLPPLEYSRKTFGALYALKNGEKKTHGEICEDERMDTNIARELATMKVLGYVQSELSQDLTTVYYFLTPKGIRLAYLIEQIRGMDVIL